MTRRNLPGGLTVALVLIVVPGLALLGLQTYQIRARAPQVANDRKLLVHTFEVISAAQALATAVRDAERGQRRYLLSGERSYLEVYEGAARDVPTLLAKLKSLTRDNPEQQRRLPNLEHQLDLELGELARTLQLSTHDGFSAVQQFLRTDAHSDAVVVIDGLIEAAIATERSLLAGRLARTAEDERSSTATARLSAALAFLTMGLGVVLLVLAFSRTRRAEMALEEARAALAQSQKIEALGQLTGGIAHDFNNLLHVIKNAIAIVRRRLPPIDPSVRQYLDMATQNTDRAAAVTQRLLAFSRQQPLDPKPIDLNKLVAGMADLLRGALGEHIAMETVLASGLWTVAADTSQLETALLNLAVNARDAIPQSGKLTIETANALLDESYAAAHPQVTPGQYVTIAVSDTGTGMTPEVIARAFDPFFTTKEAGRGTGLGLSQVFGFVKQSGGHVKLYSEPGEGTTVKIYLPRLATAAVDRAPEAEPIAARTSGETILVVEDDEDVRTFTADILRELGYRVMIASDGHVALAVLEKQLGVNLLFTDVGLPNGINGRQLADEARRRWPELKVLFTTGYARNAIVHHGRLDPGVELIVKPFTQSSLAAKVRHVLDGDVDTPA